MFRKFLEQFLHDKHVAALAVIVTNATDVAETMQSEELASQRAAIAALAPEAVLDVKRTAVAPHARRPEWRVFIRYDASLYQVPVKPMASRIWRADLEHAGPEIGMEGRFQLAAQRLVDRLDADGLLAPATVVRH